MNDDKQISDWWIYIIITEESKLYTGISTDPQRRFNEHLHKYQTKKGKGAKYFLGHKPVKIVYLEKTAGRSAATKREREIKQMRVTKKQKLISDNENQINKAIP